MPIYYEPQNLHFNEGFYIELMKRIEISRQKGVGELLRLFFDEGLLEPPSVANYNLREYKESDVGEYSKYKTMMLSWAFTRSILIDFYKDGPPGFFVEAGALDGEYLSNTLYLEKALNWTGLLIEPYRPSFKELKRKGRKSWTSPLCLATKPQPHKAVLISYADRNKWFWLNRATVQMQNKDKLSIASDGYATFSASLCIPISYLLEVLNVTHVDFFSLDVEEVEMDILRNFPFDKITVNLWVIEHISRYAFERSSSDGGAKERFIYEDVKLISFMENKGYYLFDIYCAFVTDYVFLRIDSELFRRLEVPKRLWKRRGICFNKHLLVPIKASQDMQYLRDKRHWPLLKFH